MTYGNRGYTTPFRYSLSEKKEEKKTVNAASPFLRFTIVAKNGSLSLPRMLPGPPFGGSIQCHVSQNRTNKMGGG